MKCQELFLDISPVLLNQREDTFPITELSNTSLQEVHQNLQRSSTNMGSLISTSFIQFQGKFLCKNNRSLRPSIPNQVSTFPSYHTGSLDHLQDVKSYFDKDGDTIEWGEFQIDGRSARGGCQTANDAAAEALNAPTKEVALQIIREKLPEKFLFQFHNLNSNLDRIFARAPEPWAPPFRLSSFTNVPDEMQEWADDYFGRGSAARPLRPISLIVEGGSRTGKTMWARALGPHNYFSGHLDFNSKVYSDQVEYNVIDDVAPHYLKLKHWKELIGAQQKWQTNCKYGKPRLIEGGVPSIVLCNPGGGGQLLRLPRQRGKCSIERLDTTQCLIHLPRRPPLSNRDTGLPRREQSGVDEWT
ncbi:replication-associated protein [Sida micrantha mosaic virus-[snap bean:Brazil:2003]]|nr:replication-associated protein [Sida micrantha mosaic virus-[snap bean:Brazil:2003]]